MARYIQLVTPNLDPIIYQGDRRLFDWLGWCLAFVQVAFGANWAGLTAMQCWEKYATGKHEDDDIPEGVYVPIFFNGYGGSGHTMIVKREGGRFYAWTSPNTHKPFADVIVADSLDEIKQIIKRNYSGDSNYLGWAEGIAGTQIVKQMEDTELMNEGDVRNKLKDTLGRDATDDEVNQFRVGDGWISWHDFYYSYEYFATRTNDGDAVNIARKILNKKDVTDEEKAPYLTRQWKEVGYNVLLPAINPSIPVVKLKPGVSYQVDK